jgi:hypothetical protein
MRFLLKKEALELLWPVAIVFIAIGWYWFTQESFISLLIAPHADRCLVMVTTAIIAGAVIGFLQFTAERWRGTLSFVLHRPNGYARVFVAKALVGMSAAMVVAVGPVFAFAAWQMLFSENAPLIQSGRLAEYALCGISGWSGHALGMLASQLRRGWWIDISTLVFGTIGVFVATQSTLVPGEESAALSVFIYLAVQAAFITCLSWAAFTLMEKGRDRELLLSRGQFGVFATAGLLLYVLPATILVGESAEYLRRIIPQSYPSIVRELESGAVVVADAKHLRVHGPPEDLSALFTFRCGSEETPYSETVFIPRTSAWDMRGPESSSAPQFARTFALGPWWTGLWPWNGYRSFETQDRQARMTVFIDRDEGTIRSFWLRAHEPPSYHGLQVEHLPLELPLEQTFAKPREPNRFSPSTFSVELGSNSWCLIDPEDSSMWMLALTNLVDPFSEIHLPDGDRFVRIEPFYSGRRLRVGLYSRLRSQDLFVGEKGQYVWEDGQFVSYVGDEPTTQPRAKDADDRVPLRSAEAAIELRVRQTDDDPIHPRVEVRDATGQRVLLDHTYDPETLQAHASSMLLHAYVLLRTPVMCVASFTKTDDEVGMPPRTNGLLRTEEEPLLFAGKRPWLLCLNLTLAAVSAASIVRRMRRHGASLIAIALAATVTALVGVIAYVYFRGLMPRRAPVTARSSPVSEGRELLIQSA